MFWISATQFQSSSCCLLQTNYAVSDWLSANHWQSDLWVLTWSRTRPNLTVDTVLTERFLMDGF